MAAQAKTPNRKLRAVGRGGNTVDAVASGGWALRTP
jgi:hypothetical protein